MTMIDKDDANLEAALSLREIAACYRKSAEEAGKPTVWGARLRLAVRFEKEAAALEAASNQLCRGNARSLSQYPVKRRQ